jgi:hypothetical protein
MSKFDKLNKPDLEELVEFFNKDVKAADPEKPVKAELVAALESDKDGTDPVTWEDYEEIYLPAKQSGQVKSKEVLKQEAAAEKARKEAEAEEDKDEAAAAEDDVEAVEKAEEAEDHRVETEEDEEDEALVKYERKNPTWEAAGYTFTQKHPFASVPVSVAEFLITKQKGFRLALPSEVTEYYN